MSLRRGIGALPEAGWRSVGLAGFGCVDVAPAAPDKAVFEKFQDVVAVLGVEARERGVRFHVADEEQDLAPFAGGWSPTRLRGRRRRGRGARDPQPGEHLFSGGSGRCTGGMLRLMQLSAGALEPIHRNRCGAIAGSGELLAAR